MNKRLTQSDVTDIKQAVKQVVKSAVPSRAMKLSLFAPLHFVGSRSFQMATVPSSSPRATRRVPGLLLFLFLSVFGALSTAQAQSTFIINDRIVDEGNSPTQNVTLVVTRGGTTTGTATVNYETLSDTATAGEDFVNQGVTTLTFNPGETVKAITVQVIGDTKNEANERFFVVLSGATGGAINDNTGVVTIRDDDGFPQITISDAPNVVEGDSGTRNATFTVSLTGNTTDRTITVNYATVAETGAGKATVNSDYTATNGTLQFDPGVRQQTITVPVRGDVVDEVDETFLVRLSNPNPAVTISDGDGQATILDDDGPNLTVTDATGNEGNSLTFTISLTDPSTGQPATSPQDISLTVRTTDIDATSNVDYQAVDRIITIAANTPSTTVSVQTNTDTVNEGDEIFVLEITARNNPSRVNIVDGQGTGTIVNAPPPVPAVSIANALTAEGNNGTQNLDFTVTLSNATNAEVRVDYRIDRGTSEPAAEASDFTGDGTVSAVRIPANATTGTISVPVIGDTIDEDDERFTVTITGVSNNAKIGTQSVGIGTIINDDTAPNIGVTSPAPQNEGTGGTTEVTFIVSLSSRSEKTVTVDYLTSDGSAMFGGTPSDYDRITATRLTFLPGETTKNVKVTVRGDSQDEDDNETFFLDLQSAVNAQIPNGTRGQATIVDDDLAPSVIIDSPQVQEGDTSSANLRFAVTLTAPSAKVVTVNYVTRDGSATSSGTGPGKIDFTPQSGTVTFPLNTTGPQFITVPVIGDTIDEDNEVLFVDITGAVNANGTPSGAGTIIDNDALPALTISAPTIVEGNDADPTKTPDLVYTVTLTPETTRTVTVGYNTVPTSSGSSDPAEAGSDYDSVSGTLTFNPGETTKTIVVQAKGDDVDEFDEAVPVVLSNPINAQFTSVSDSVGLGIILDDDALPRYIINDLTLDPEGDPDAFNNPSRKTLRFTVTRQGRTERTTSVGFSTGSGGSNGDLATQDVDFETNSGTLTFGPALIDVTNTVSVVVLGDLDKENTETFVVNLFNTVNSTLAGGDNQGVGTIVDDDIGPPTVNNGGFAVDPTVGFPPYGTVANGTEVTITGTNFDGSATVQFSGANGGYISGPRTGQTATEVKARVPVGAVSGPLRVVTRRGTASTRVFYVQPTVNDFSPRRGVRFVTTVSVSGSNFLDPLNPITDVKFGGASVVGAGGTFNIVDNTTLTVLVQGNAVSGPISLVSQRGGDGPNSSQNFTVDAVSDGGIKFATPTPTYILPENADIPQNTIVRTLVLEPARQQSPGNPQISPLGDIEVDITIAATAAVFNRIPIITIENTRTGAVTTSSGNTTRVVFPAGSLGFQTTYRISTIYTGDDIVEDAGPVKDQDQNINLSATIVKNNNDPYYPTTGAVSSTPTITDTRRDLHGILVDTTTVLRTTELGDADPNNAGVAEFTITPANLDFLDPFGPNVFNYGNFDNTALGEGSLFSGPDGSPKNLDPRPKFDVLVNLQSSRPNEGLIRYFIDDQDNDGAGPDTDTDGPNARTPIQPIPQANQVVLFAVDETSNEFYRNRHIIQVVGQDDTGFDGDQVFQVVAESVFSADPEFSGATLDKPVTLVNTDDESNTDQGNQPGFVFSPPNRAGQPVTFAAPSGLQTNENGSTAIFTVKLNKQPTANVTMTLNSQDVGEGLLIDPVTGNQVQQITLTFTPNTPPAGSPANVTRWDIQQTVTVKGQDDSLQDGDQAYFIETESSSADNTYNQIDPPDVLITNMDNETAGVTVSPSLLVIPEGQSRTFSVVLNLQPTSDVFINLRSSSAEGTINKTRLTFTPTNWNIPQTVTVTAKDDIVDDPDANFQIILDPALSSDANYNGNDPQDVNVVNLNDDNVGITVTPPSGLTTSESGTTATFTVRLNSPPTADVTVSYTSNDTSEGLLSTSLDPTPRQTVQLTFTSLNYNQAQTVRIIGQDDALQDGDIQYLILANDSASTDTKYNGLKSSDISVTNTDNEVAGFTITPTSITTSESGTTATFTVRLNLRPTANVTIPVSSSNTAEGRVAPTNLTFTPTNFATPQTVTVTGQNDLVRDGNQDYTIVLGAATSADTQYNNLNPDDVTATNIDDETPDIVVTPVSGLETSETRTKATFTVRLSSPPTAPVTINLTSSDTSEGVVSPSSLTFTDANFNVPQTVTVTGVDDPEDDGDIAYSIVTAPANTTDADYNGLNAPDVTLINRDDEAPGLLITPTALTVNENSGTATFTVRLVTRPTANVTIPVTSGDTNQGTVTPTTLTFTPTGFDQAQTVTISIPDDRIDEDTAVFNVQLGPTTSTDTDYSGLVRQVRVTVIDNDTAGVTITPATSLTSRLRTTEANGVNKRATFQVRLNSQPTSQVTITLSSSDATEGALINPIDNLPSTSNSRTLVFDATNFATPQTVTIEGVDDNLDDGNINYSIITAPAQSNDANYNTLNPADVLANNVDNDTGGIVITPTSGLSVRERGNSATFTAVLASQPLNTVVFSLSSSDTTEGVPSANRLVFAASNWNVPQTVTVRPVDDLVDDDNQTFTIITGRAVASGDPIYNNLDPADVQVTNIDDDTAGLSVRPNSPTSSGLFITREDGARVSFSVKLLSQPTSNVIVNITTTDTTEGVASPTSLTFTPANYNTLQTSFVSGVDDTLEDGHINYTINVASTVPAGGDAKYMGQSVPGFAARNLDNDDNTKPNVAITSPTPNQVFRSITSVFGTASDAKDPASFFVSGIKRVEVQLVRYDDPTTPESEVGYYNKDNGKFELPRNTATTGNPQLLPATYNASRQAWVANLPQTATNSLAEGLYAVVAYATDGKDNRQISEAVNFRVDMTPPVVAITTPADGATLNTLPRATGTASDAGGSGVNRVEVTVIRQANSANGLTFGYLAKDGSFTSTFTVANNRLPATLSGSNWAASLPTLPRAAYTITAYAFDNSGRGSAPDTHRFTITGTNEFAGNTSFLISIPYMDGASVSATTTPTKAFTVPPTDPTTGRVNYRLQRYNPLTMDWETLGNGSTLRRGEGYLLTPVASGVSIKRPSDDPTRIPLDSSVQEFQVTLRNQPSLAPDADGNGWNLIGDPFNPALFSSAEWLTARVTANIGGQTFTGTVAEAADRGILDRRLFNYNPSAATSGGSLYTPVSGNLLPFRGYFVRTFVDGVQVNLRAVSR
jgi:hypothetical protein